MDEVEKEFLEFFQRVAAPLFSGEMPTRMVALLYMSPEPISMEDLARKTGYSLASVSNTMKLLESLHVVSRISKPKTKKAYFYMDKDIMAINKQKFLAMQEYMIKPIKQELPMLIKKFREKKLSSGQKKKLALVEDYYSQVSEFEKIIRHVIEDMDMASMQRKKPLRYEI